MVKDKKFISDEQIKKENKVLPVNRGFLASLEMTGIEVVNRGEKAAIRILGALCT